MTTTLHPFFAQATNSQSSTSNILPKGTCDNQTYEIFELHKNILNEPSAELYAFPFASKYGTWIIVRENVAYEEPIFHLYYDMLKKRFLSAQKQTNNIGCNYIISKKERPKKDEFFVAKVRGNFRNSEFWVYDNGQNPKKKCNRKRKQLAYLRLDDDSIFSQSSKPKVQILVPSVERDPQANHIKSLPKQLTPNDQKQNLLLQAYQTRSPSAINLFQKQSDHSLTPEQLLASYFTSLENKAETINAKFQMDKSLSSCPVLSLCSRTKNTFALNFGYPLNMIQGFGVSLALIERAQF